MILALIAAAVAAGARPARACQILGLSRRTIERWRAAEIGEDARAGPQGRSHNALCPHERVELLATVNAPLYRDLSPNQIVPRLADEGRYLASESTIYRLLRSRQRGSLAGRGAGVQHHQQLPLFYRLPLLDINLLDTACNGGLNGHRRELWRQHALSHDDPVYSRERGPDDCGDKQENGYPYESAGQQRRKLYDELSRLDRHVFSLGPGNFSLH